MIFEFDQEKKEDYFERIAEKVCDMFDVNDICMEDNFDKAIYDAIDEMVMFYDIEKYSDDFEDEEYFRDISWDDFENDLFIETIKKLNEQYPERFE